MQSKLCMWSYGNSRPSCTAASLLPSLLPPHLASAWSPDFRAYTRLPPLTGERYEHGRPARHHGNRCHGCGTVHHALIPIADKTTGDLLIVTGSTNLPAGTILMVQAGGDGVGYGGDTMVREGTGGVNRFSAPVDTSILKPGMRTITVTQMIGNITNGDYRFGTLNGTATFTLKGTYLGSDTPVQPAITRDDYIRLNAIGDRSVGDQFLITGTTSLPVGTNHDLAGHPGQGNDPGPVLT